ALQAEGQRFEPVNFHHPKAMILLDHGFFSCSVRKSSCRAQSGASAIWGGVFRTAGAAKKAARRPCRRKMPDTCVFNEILTLFSSIPDANRDLHGTGCGCIFPAVSGKIVEKHKKFQNMIAFFHKIT